MTTTKTTRRDLLKLFAGTGLAVASAPALIGADARKVWAISFPRDADPERVTAILQRVKDDGRQLYEAAGMRMFPVYSALAQPTGAHVAYVLA